MNNNKNKRKNILKVFFNFFEAIITIFIVLICIIILTQRISNNEKSFLGYRLFKIETGSMVPKYKINDVILVKETDINNIKIEDDLVYIGTDGQYRGKIITHQVIDVKGEGETLKFYTKGLANNTVDPVVEKSQVIGIVQNKVYTLTLITNLLLNIYSLYFLIIVPIILNLFFSVLHSDEKRERYLEKRRSEEKKELERQKKIEAKKKK